MACACSSAGYYIPVMQSKLVISMKIMAVKRKIRKHKYCSHSAHSQLPRVSEVNAVLGIGITQRHFQIYQDSFSSQVPS